ncbi:MAG: mechanosensitive ion channel domain-containing protein, partial [Gemmatimonadota bacterium]
AGPGAGPPPTLQEARQRLEHIGRRVALALVFLLVLGAFSRLLVWTLNSLAERSAKRRLLYKRLVPILRISLWVFAAYFVIQVIFHVTTANLLAAGAAVGVAVGFAAQDLLKNVFGGLVIIFDQPFQVGDKITVGDTYGEVVSIGLRSTRVVTPSDSMVSVPNALVVDSQVSNANSGALDCQVVTELFLPGWVDEALAKRLAYDAAAVSPYAYLKKPIVVLVGDEFRETFLTRIKIKAYVLDARYEFLFQSDVTERARDEFRKHGLIPTYKDAQDLIELTRTANES